MKRYITAGIILILIVCDQITKLLAVLYLKPVGTTKVIPGVLSFQYLENTGVAFGMFQGKQIFVTIFTGVLVIVVLLMAFKPMIRSKLFITSMAFIAAGGIGNLLDRFTRGYVVDFLHFHPLFDYIFNLADVFVNVGVILAIIYILFIDRKMDDGIFKSEKKNEISNKQ